MSGPKCDSVEVEKTKKQELERKRQEKLKEIKKATDHYIGCQLSVRNDSLSIQNECRSIIEKCRGLDGCQQIITDIKEINNYCSKIEAEFFGSKIPAEPGEIRSQADCFVNRANDAFKKNKDQIKQIKNKINNILADKEKNDKLIDIRFDGSKVAESGFTDMDIVFVLEEIKKADKGSEDTQSTDALPLAEEIGFLLNSDSLCRDSMRELSTALMGLYNNVINGTLYSNTTISACKNLVEEKKKESGAFESEYKEYYAEYIAYVELLNSYNAPIDIYPKEKYDFETLFRLQAERAALKKAYADADEQYYIKTQISEVMKDFGFDLTDEICFGAFASGKDYLCENVSDKTAVHIHMSNSNQVMMEIVGIDPGKNSAGNHAEKVLSDDLPSNEQERLLKAQGAFCSMHPKIVEELEKRGVLLGYVDHKEPDKKYSSVIYKPSYKNSAEPNINLINTGYSGERRRRNRTVLREREI